MKMNVEHMKVSELIPYDKNAKKHPKEQIEYIANSLKRFGWKQPLVIDKNNVVVAGHGRLEAAKKLKMDEVPCIRADDLTDDEIKAFRLADNKTAESEWDLELLDIELDEIACEQTGRTCYMAELSPEYVDVIIDRWEKLTGNKAVKLN